MTASSTTPQILGEPVWKATGLGASDDIDTLNRRIIALEQQVDLRQQLDERADDLDAARAANRELLSRLNRP